MNIYTDLVLPYVYKITHKETGEFYVGSRFVNVRFNRTPEEDLLIYYFTSSSHQKQIKIEADRYVKEILFYHGNDEAVYWYEQLSIREHIKNSLCMNEQYVDPDNNEQKFSTFGRPQTEDTKQKIADSMKDVPKTDEAKQNMSNSALIRAQDMDLRKQVSKKMTGIKRDKLECPHCGKIGSMPGMSRFHFDNCSKKE